MGQRREFLWLERVILAACSLDYCATTGCAGGQRLWACRRRYRHQRQRQRDHQQHELVRQRRRLGPRQHLDVLPWVGRELCVEIGQLVITSIL